MLAMTNAWRAWRTRPALAGLVAATLAIGFAAPAVVVTLVQAVLIAPLPYGRPEQLAVVSASLPGQQQAFALLAGPELVEIAARSRTLGAAGGVWARPAVLRQPAVAAVEIEVGWYTPGFLEAFAVAPLIGRLPTAVEAAERGQVAVLSYDLWRTRYAGDPAILGRRLDIDGDLVTVIGVMSERFRVMLPPEFGVPERLDAWLPWGPGLDALPRSFRVFAGVARIESGVTWGATRGDLDELAAAVARADIAYARSGLALSAAPLAASLAAPVRPTLVALSAVVALVFAIAAANVTNLMLTRALERGREISVQLALGARRAELWRQWLIESAGLGALGGLIGLAIAHGVVAAIRESSAPIATRLRDAALGWPALILVFAGVVAVAIGIGSIAAAHAVSVAARSPLQTTTRGMSSRMGATRRALVIAQVALSLALASGAGLMLRTFLSLTAVPLGFDPEGVVSVRLSLPDGRYPYDTSGPEIGAVYRRIEARLLEIPGVRAVGATINPPLSDLPMRPRPFAYRTGDGEVDWGTRTADYRTVTAGWFEAVAVQLVSGRFLDATDTWDRPIAVVVNERLAARAWPGRDPIGQAIRVELFREARFTPTWGEVVGVVQSIRQNSLVGDEREQIFLAHGQAPQRTMYPAIRVSGDPLAVLPAVQQAVSAIESDLPVFDVRLASDYVARSMAITRFALMALGAFAVLAVVLAAAGVYAALAGLVSRRRREVGIRLAIGATPGAVRRLVLSQGLGLVFSGVMIGVAGALASTRVLASLLHGVAPTDPPTFVAAATLMMLAGLAACWVPAHRASAVDPREALQSE